MPPPPQGHDRLPRRGIRRPWPVVAPISAKWGRNRVSGPEGYREGFATMAFSQPVMKLRARLATGAPEGGEGRPRVYRPLVIGPAVLVRRSDTRGPWEVPVTADGRLRPVVPTSRSALARDLARLTHCGHQVRVTAALVAPVDASDGQNLIGETVQPRIGTDFYGWSLLYQFPHLQDVARVDPHEHHPDLPAMYESPLELVDRAEFLASHGITSRPLAVVVQPADFTADAAGRLVNRFFPDGQFRIGKRRGWPA